MAEGLARRPEGESQIAEILSAICEICVRFPTGLLEPLYIYIALFIFINKKGRYIGGAASRVVHHQCRTLGMGGMTAQAPEPCDAAPPHML